MSTAILEPPARPRQTTEDLLALPDDGVERWLVDGQIVEVGMTIRNKHHTRVEFHLCRVFGRWWESAPQPRGMFHAGEVGVILREDPELTVGIDAVYLNAEQAVRNEGDDETTILVGPPTLAVEILSPSAVVENLRRKIDHFMACGVPLVWVIDPHFRTVTIHRPQHPPVLLNEQQELDGGADLPGFRVPVARLFER